MDVLDSHVEDLTFRQAMQELEAIVAKLEGGELELEDSLTCYERGVSLLKSLKVRLSTAEQKIETLMEDLEFVPEDDTRDVTLS